MWLEPQGCLNPTLSTIAELKRGCFDHVTNIVLHLSLKSSRLEYIKSIDYGYLHVLWFLSLVS